MSAGSNLRRVAGALLVSAALLCAGTTSLAKDTAPHSQKKKKPQQPQLPALPSGPTGQPVQQIPLDNIAAVPPQVSYENNQLTIVAPNSTLADILRAVRKLTGAEIDVPPAPERVVTHLGPGPARAVVAELLNGSRFNYVLLGSPADDSVLTRVVLVAKSGAENSMANAAPPAQVNSPPQTDPAADAEAQAAEDTGNADDNPDQASGDDQDQQVTQPEQPGAKTPQQILQEMQQRQLQLQQQQQQQNGQPVPQGQPIQNSPQDR